MLTALLVLNVYFGLGLLFAIWFAFVGAQRIDPVAANAGVRFKLLIIPGAAALWPHLLLKSLRTQGKGA
jgi:hypothetical protein